MSSYFLASWLAHKQPLDYVKNKEVSTQYFINYMLLRLQKMFKYDNLPETVPREFLESYLLTNGSAFFTKVKDSYYILVGSAGGEPDPYYRPTKYNVANPALNLSETYDIVNDGVLMRNDSMWIGLYPLMSRYASLLAENILTIRSADVMLRILALITAPDDTTKASADEYLAKLEKGEFGAIADKSFLDGIKMQSPPSNNGSYLTQFIELQQYLWGSFCNEIGLNANFNMKREAIGDGESSLNLDSLFPLCEEMLRCRKEDIEKINTMFNLNISVDFDSSWFVNEKELKLDIQQKENASQLAENSVKGGEKDECSSTEANDNEIDNSGSEDSDGDSSATYQDDESRETESEESERGGGSAEIDNCDSDNSTDSEIRGDSANIDITINIENQIERGEEEVADCETSISDD